MFRVFRLTAGSLARSSSLKLSLSIAVDSAPVNDDRDVVCSKLIAVNLHEGNIAKIAELEHNVAGF